MIYSTLPLGDYEDKVCIISGGASGMGRSCARLLASAGVKLALVDMNLAGLGEVAKETGLPADRLLLKEMDICDEASIDLLYKEIEAKFGRLDYAVVMIKPKATGSMLNFNGPAAGVTGRETMPFVETTQKDFDWVMDINLRAQAMMCRRQIELMLKNKLDAGSSSLFSTEPNVGWRAVEGRGTAGAIVNICSWSSTHGHASIVAYTASKHALAGLTKCLAMTYAKDGIRINGIAPGVIETPMVTPEFKASFSPTLMPAHRLGQPEEIADAVAFLLSARASFIHGHLLSVDGGWNAK